MNTALLIALLLTAFVFLASLYVVAFALFGIFKPQAPGRRSYAASFLVLVPAHNEGEGIKATILSLRQAAYPEDRMRVVVIADNCTDNTAEIAAACGADVWVRNDTRNPGKGQALAWALAQARSDIDLVAVIDADSEVDPDFFSLMAGAYSDAARRGQAAVVLQARYLFAKTAQHASAKQATAQPATKQQPSWFEAFTISSKAAENSFTYRPRTALGLANLIQGNGFCMSRAALAAVPFLATSIVEDAEYAIALALEGVPVRLVDKARVTSRMTRRVSEAAPQRQRWASGFFALLVQAIPRLLTAALRRRSWRPAEMAVMLLLTSRLVILYATVVAAAILSAFFTTPDARPIAAILCAAALLQAIYLFLIFRKADSEPVPLLTIAFLPFYVGFLGVLQLGAAFGLKRRQWVRTVR
jgi:cellulose synthase/poly-beta-1,6-N-acetylglucosamine synthase-like glycosyltransferase